MLWDADFVDVGINTSVLMPVTNVCRTKVPLDTFSPFKYVSNMPDDVCW